MEKSVSNVKCELCDAEAVRFINAYFETYKITNMYIPAVIIFVICQHTDTSLLNGINVKRIKRLRSERIDVKKKIAATNNVFGDVKYITATAPIIFSSFMKIDSSDVGAILTKDYFILTSAFNFQTWEQFKNRSKIYDLVS
eukprot:543199_1